MNSQEDLILADFNGDSELTYEQIVTRLLNFWRHKLMARTLAYHAIVGWSEEEPGGTMPGVDRTTGGKRDIPFTELINDRIAVVKEARHYVTVLEKMLERAKDGTIVDMASNQEVLKVIDTTEA